MKYTFRRIDDDRFEVLIDGKVNSVFRLKGWMNNLKSYPNNPGVAKTNRFSITNAQYNGFFE